MPFVPMVPVLVNGARMPKPEELPDSLKSFSFRNAAEIDSGRDFRQHMERLIRSIDSIVGLRARTPGTAGRSRPMFWFSGIAALLLIGAAGFFARDVLQRNVAKDIAAAPAGDTVVDFSAYPVGKDPVAARPYLNKYGISVDNMVPQDSEIVLINNRGLYEGGGVMPSASQIFLTQIIRIHQRAEDFDRRSIRNGMMLFFVCFD